MNEILKQEAGELLFGACKEIKEKLALTYVWNTHTDIFINFFGSRYSYFAVL